MLDTMNDQEEYKDGFPICNVRKCKCGVSAKVMVAWTEKNPGRRFFKCAKPQGEQCSFFRWYDEEYAPHLKYMLYTMKKESETLQMEVQNLRADMFQLQYLSDHASEIDAIAIERELNEAKEKLLKLAEVEASEAGLKLELKQMKGKLLMMPDIVKELEEMKNDKGLLKHVVIGLVAVIMSLVIMICIKV